MPISNPNAVIADTFDVKADHEEGFADEELRPGLGCTIDDSGSETTIVLAGQNSRTKRLVKAPEQSGDAPSVGGIESSPIDETIPANAHTYTVGFRRYHKGRARLADSSTAAAGDDVGWNSNGELSDVQTDGTTALTTFVGVLREIISDSSLDSDIAVVEFY